MNPRIRSVSLLRDGKVIAKATLDIGRRDLQTIALPSPESHVRLRVEEIMPGTKRAWRETCVAELEAWGALPPGATVGKYAPAVDVGERLPDGSTDAIADETTFSEHEVVYAFHWPGFDTTDPATDLEQSVTCNVGTKVECTPPVDVN